MWCKVRRGCKMEYSFFEYIFKNRATHNQN
jgi:hypothetical protein